LTALCIAFGSRAKSTQRAAALKDFIKTGCRLRPPPVPPLTSLLVFQITD
jgi:hypothetical protein